MKESNCSKFNQLKTKSMEKVMIIKTADEIAAGIEKWMKNVRQQKWNPVLKMKK